MRRALLAAGVAFALLAALTLDKRDWPGHLFADEATYYGMALSLGYDGDVVFTAEDARRINADFGSGASGSVVMNGAAGSGEVLFSKPVLYSLVAALPVRLLGPNGMLLVNVIAFLLTGLAIWLHFATAMPRERADLAALSFMLASAAMAYLTWLMPECLAMALVSWGLLLSLPALPGASGATVWCSSARFALAGGVLLGAAGSLRYPHLALLALPVGLALRRRLPGRALLVVVGAALGVLCLAATTRALTGYWDPYTGPRWSYVRTAEGWPPIAPRSDDSPLPAADWHPGGPVWGLDTPLALAYDGVYSLFGRHTGWALYFPMALIAIGHGFKARRYGFLAVLAAFHAFYIVWLPFNWFGGASFVGDRYFLGAYPALAFLIVRPLSWRTLVGVWAWAGLTVSAVTLTPFRPRTFDDGTQVHTRGSLFRLAPVETTAWEFDGVEERRWAGLMVRSTDPFAELGDETLRLRGGARPAELLVVSQERLGRLFLDVRPAVAGALEVEDWGELATHALAAGAPAVVSVQLSPALRYHEMWFKSSPHYIYVLDLSFRPSELSAHDWPVEIEVLGGDWVIDEALARVEVLGTELPASFKAGATAVVSVALSNPTGRVWHARGGGAVRAAYRWLDAERTIVEGRGSLPWDVQPAGGARLDLSIEMPTEPGSYTLEVGLLIEHVRWFTRSDGSPILSRLVEVEAP